MINLIVTEIVPVRGRSWHLRRPQQFAADPPGNQIKTPRLTGPDSTAGNRIETLRLTTQGMTRFYPMPKARG